MDGSFQKELSRIKSDLVDVMREVPEIPTEQMQNYEEMKGHLIMQVIPVKGNEESLKEMPHRKLMDYVDLMKNLSIVPEAWGPLAGGKHGIFTDPVLTEIGGKYGKTATAAQVALRWNVQRGVVIILKSTHVERMEQNLDIWDFSLTDEEMAKISAKDLGRSEIVDHSDPAFVKMILDWNIHD